MTDTAIPTDPTLAWIHQAFGMDPAWCTLDGDHQFTWWPSRYPQTITAKATDTGIRVTARTLLATNLPDPELARGVISRQNAGSIGSAAHLDDTDRSLLLTASNTIEVDDRADLALFADTALLQAISADAVAPALAGVLEGTGPVIAHPTSGVRPDRDQILDMLTYWWSRPEYVITPHLTNQLFDDLAEGLEHLRVEHADTTLVGITRNEGQFTLIFPLTQEGAHASVTAGYTRHPDIGRTFSVVLATALHYANPLDAQAAADHLNLTTSASNRAPGLGAWWARDGQLCWSTYLQDNFLATFPHHDPLRGRRLAELIWTVSARAHQHSLTLAHPFAHPAQLRPWVGLQHLPDGALTWFPDRVAAESDIPRLVREHQDSGLILPIDTVGPEPDLVLGTWGIVNPAGPTLTTIGFTGTPNGWLFVEWMRHPTYPQVRVHAVYDDLTPEAISQACTELLVGKYGDPEATIVPIGLPEFVTPPPEDSPAVAVREALLTIAATQCDPHDLLRAVLVYRRYANDPWARLFDTYEAGWDASIPDGPVDPDDAAAQWWDAATDGTHLDSSMQALLDAWDGTTEFLLALAEGRAIRPEGTL